MSANKFLFKEKERGVSLVITFFLMGISLSIVLGVTTIMYGENKIVQNFGYWVPAYYIADSGVETALYLDNKVQSAITNSPNRAICNCALVVANLPANETLAFVHNCSVTSGSCSSKCENCTVSFDSGTAGVDSNTLLTSGQKFTTKVEVSSSTGINASNIDRFYSTGSFPGAFGTINRAIQIDILKPPPLPQ